MDPLIDLPSSARTRAFSLMEVMVAVAVVAIAVIPLMGLIPLSLKNSEISSEEAQALAILTAVVQDFRFTPLKETKSVVFKLPSLPYNGAQLHKKNRVWVDSYWNIYPFDKKPSTQAFELEWEYGVIPEIDSFAAVEAAFCVRWPSVVENPEGPKKKLKPGDEVTCLVAFPRPKL